MKKLPKDVKDLNGKRAMVFDSRLWEANGGDSESDRFFRPATIVSAYWKDNDAMADVKFDHRDKLSKGHFVFAMEEENSTYGSRHRS